MMCFADKQSAGSSRCVARTLTEGLTPRDLEPYIGQSGRVSEVLNRKRALSLRVYSTTAETPPK